MSSVKEKELSDTGKQLDQDCTRLVGEVESIRRKIRSMISAGRGDYMDWLRTELDHFAFELKMFKHDNDIFKEPEQQMSAPVAGRNPDARLRAGSIPAADA